MIFKTATVDLMFQSFEQEKAKEQRSKEYRDIVNDCDGELSHSFDQMLLET